MLRLLKHAVVPALLIAFASTASAQQVVKICVPGTNSSNGGNSCPPVDPTNPLPSSNTEKASGIFHAATVGTSSAQVIAASTATNYIYLGNPSAAGGNTVYCQFGGTPTVAGAGSISIAPGQVITLENSQVDTSILNCISSGASTPFTYGVH